MEKVTDSLRAKFKGDKKGTLYLYLIKANELAFINQYSKFNIDSVVPEHYVENRLNEVFNRPNGAYWKDDYKGQKELLKAGQAAQSFIKQEMYTPEVIRFVETALKSYLPKGEKRIEEVKTIEMESHIGKIIAPGVTGEQLKAGKIKAEELAILETEQKEFLEENLSLLDEENEGADLSLTEKYKDAKPIEEFMSVHGSPIYVMGKDGAMYYIKFGDSKYVIPKTEEQIEEFKTGVAEEEEEQFEEEAEIDEDDMKLL